MKHTPSHRAPATGRTPRLVAAAVVATAAATALLVPGTSAGASTTTAPTVQSLNVRSGGTWGYDLVTVKGTNFTGSSKVAYVLFGSKKADGFSVVNSTTLQANSPEVTNKRAVVDVRVVLANGTKSPASSADRFTYVVPTMNTRQNGGWTANQSIAIGRKMMGKTRQLNSAPVAHNPGYWTPAMGQSALHRAAGWLGLPYSWAGGSYTGPSYGSKYGDGLIGSFSDKIWGFDCSGLTMYSWAKYEHIAHYAATQRNQAGKYHPALAELQPGDLLFFSHGGSTISHVVMYSGKGMIIQAASSGYPVRYSTLASVLVSHPRYFGAVRPMSTGRQSVAPVLTSVSSATSATKGGSLITIRGSHLDTTSRVSFGSTTTYDFSIRSSSTLVVRVPAHTAGTANVYVSNAWGTSKYTSHARMAYVAPPTVTSASTATGTTTGGSTVTVNGTSFTAGAKVYFGSTAATVRAVSSTKLTVTAPAHAAGKVAITVTTPYGSGKGGSYTYLAPTPTSTSPSSPRSSASTSSSSSVSPSAPASTGASMTPGAGADR